MWGPYGADCTTKNNSRASGLFHWAWAAHVYIYIYTWTPLNATARFRLPGTRVPLKPFKKKNIPQNLKKLIIVNDCAKTWDISILYYENVLYICWNSWLDGEFNFSLPTHIGAGPKARCLEPLESFFSRTGFYWLRKKLWNFFKEYCKLMV